MQCALITNIYNTMMIIKTQNVTITAWMINIVITVTLSSLRNAERYLFEMNSHDASCAAVSFACTPRLHGAAAEPEPGTLGERFRRAWWHERETSASLRRCLETATARLDRPRICAVWCRRCRAGQTTETTQRPARGRRSVRRSSLRCGYVLHPADKHTTHLCRCPTNWSCPKNWTPTAEHDDDYAVSKISVPTTTVSRTCNSCAACVHEQKNLDRHD